MKKEKLFLIIASLFTLCAGLYAKDDAYTYDFWEQPQKSPDVYSVTHVVYADGLKLDEPLKNPTNLFCKDNFVYVTDTDNNRIVQLEYTSDKKLVPVRIIDHFNSNGQVEEKFSAPKDIFVNADGSMFIADTNNSRVVKLDKDLNYIMTLKEPDDPTYDSSKQFLPEKVIADSKGRAYVIARNLNRGFVKYEYDGKFQGFFGANKVIFDFTDYLWKKFSTKEQRDQMASFSPTEFTNAFMDKEGFIYAVTKTFDEWDLLSGDAKPIRRLNALGDDILVENAFDPPVGDLTWGTAAGIQGSSKFSDITVLDDEIYIALDETHGRIFAYDNQGYLLFAFGNRGNIDGFFRLPCSIEHIGKDLFVLDNTNASITVLSPTEFGNYIYLATEQYGRGEYDESAETWNKVLQQNANYDLAYIGLGKSYLRKNEYKKAMDCFKLKRDRRDYSKAFGYYRKEWVEEHFSTIAGIVIGIIALILIIKIIKYFKREFKSL